MHRVQMRVLDSLELADVDVIHSLPPRAVLCFDGHTIRPVFWIRRLRLPAQRPPCAMARVSECSNICDVCFELTKDVKNFPILFVLGHDKP